MKALLTGSTGFIGRKMLARLLLLDYEVIEINEVFLDSIVWKDELREKITSEIDVIFHVGACSNTLEQDVNYIMKVNYEFTKQISIIAEDLRIPLIYSSSAAAYGVDGKLPSNLYGWSKFSGEDFVVKSGGIALRYFNVYGPGEEDKGIMASFLYQAYRKYRKGETVKLFPGNPLRDFVYIEDVVSANFHAYSNYSSLEKRYYEVGSGRQNSFESVLALAGIEFEYLDKSEIPEGYQFSTQSISTKWMNGWQPAFDLSTGVRDYLEYLKVD
jgi:ADP-L-glycero-D-manno-heptose 6-epimerase